MQATQADRRQVEFFFDVGSPASYLAWTQLPRLCEQAEARLVYRPMLLGAVFQATGNASPAAVPAKGRYSSIDMQRHAARYGVPLLMNPFFPIMTLGLMRSAVGVQTRVPERLDAYLQTVFNAIWVDGLDLNDPTVTADVLRRGGFDPETVVALGNDPQIKLALRTATEEAIGRGVFGAPTMFVGQDMFFGQDRLDFVRQALQGAKTSVTAAADAAP